jgi:hypothetical protein
MAPLDFYREQAQFQQDAASSAALPQVRERCLRAATAWTNLADRAQKTADARALTAGSEPR